MRLSTPVYQPRPGSPVSSRACAMSRVSSPKGTRARGSASSAWVNPVPVSTSSPPTPQISTVRTMSRAYAASTECEAALVRGGSNCWFIKAPGFCHEDRALASTPRCGSRPETAARCGRNERFQVAGGNNLTPIEMPSAATAGYPHVLVRHGSRIGDGDMRMTMGRRTSRQR